MTDKIFPIHDVTARGDEIASRMREFYETNRPSWWERRKRRWEVTCDNLMLGLLGQAEYWTHAYTPKDEWDRAAYVKRLDAVPYHPQGPEVSAISEVVRSEHRQGALGYDDGTYMECARAVLNGLSRRGYIVVPAPDSPSAESAVPIPPVEER